MKFTNWLKSIFYGVEENSVGEKIVFVNGYTSTLQSVAIEEFAIHSAINLIAGTISKCEFRTFLNNNEVKGDEYYLFNIEPNKNQNSSQFIQEIVKNLLYDNECLVIDIGGQLVIADSFYQDEYALKENVFKQVTRGTLTFDKTFYMSDVLYFRLADESIHTLLKNFCKSYSKLIGEAIDKYEKSGGQKGVVDIDTVASGADDFEEELNLLMNERFKKFFESKNAVLPLMDGYKYTAQNVEQIKKAANEITDIKSLTDQAFERVGQAFKIPPAMLKGDIADIDSLTNNYLTFCIDPMADLMSEEINRKRYGKSCLKGSYLTVDTSCIKHIDVFEVAEKIDKLISDRIYNPNEIRRKLGDAMINRPWADEYTMTKNLESVKGGEEN